MNDFFSRISLDVRSLRVYEASVATLNDAVTAIAWALWSMRLVNTLAILFL